MWFNSSPFKGNADRLPWVSPGTQTLPRKGFKSPGKSHLELGSGLGPSPGLILPPGHLDGIQDSRDPRDVGTSRIPLRVCPRGSAGIREHPRGASGDPGMPSTGITPLGTAAGLRSRECGAGHIPGAPSLRKELFENPEPGGWMWSRRGGMWGSPGNPDLQLLQRHHPGIPGHFQGQQRLLLGHFSGSAPSLSRARCRGAFPVPILRRYVLTPNTNHGSHSQ